MKVTKEKRKQIQNEMIFRRSNEAVAEDLEMLNTLYKENQLEEMLGKDSDLLYFKCECSDENCHGRIRIKLGMYKKLHKDRHAFIVKPNHEVKDIEKIIHSTKTYTVVRKFITLSSPGEKLQKTNVENV